MCGIAGVVRHGGLADQDRHAVQRLPALLAHRGPDGAGRYEDPSCALVQTRLAVIGPAAHPLPLRSHDGRYILVYNGALYNFEELRRQLEPHTTFVTGTDTEVVLAAWIHWGPNALARFNGMFAFFVWDALLRRGAAACDRLGIKPFIYHSAPGAFWFASEAGALLESGAVPFAPNHRAIAEHLTAPYFSSALQLPFAGLHRLPQGHYMEVTREGVAVSEYFRFDFTPAQSPPPLADALEKAVTRTMRADAPVGVFLSGGVDSSLIATIAQRHSRHPVPAWTISYEGEEGADYARSLIVRSADAPWARSVAARAGLSHSMVRVDRVQYEAALERTLRANDLISAWEQEISQNILAEAAARSVKAVLVGDAADETHFGYSFLLDPDRIASPRRVIDYFGAVPLRSGDGAADFEDQYRRFAESLGYSWRTPHDQRLAMSILVYRLWLVRLLHNGDIHLMAHSLEGRVPFGDIDLLARARTVPPEAAWRDGVEKWHLRSEAARFLDPEIAWRPKSALTKNLLAHEPIHRHFVQAWRRLGALIEPHVDADAVERMAKSGPADSDRDTGLRFRLLALLTWFGKFAAA